MDELVSAEWISHPFLSLWHIIHPGRKLAYLTLPKSLVSGTPHSRSSSTSPSTVAAGTTPSPSSLRTTLTLSSSRWGLGEVFRMKMSQSYGHFPYPCWHERQLSLGPWCGEAWRECHSCWGVEEDARHYKAPHVYWNTTVHVSQCSEILWILQSE